MDSSLLRESPAEPDKTESRIAELQQKLREVERRLGTPDERPDDMQAARDCAHEISNLRMRLDMLMELARHKRRRALRCRS